MPRGGKRTRKQPLHYIGLDENKLSQLATRAAASAALYNVPGVLCSVKKTYFRLLQWNPLIQQCISRRDLLQFIRRHAYPRRPSSYHEATTVHHLSVQDRIRVLQSHHRLPRNLLKSCGAIDQLSDTRFTPRFWVLILPEGPSSTEEPFDQVMTPQVWRSRNRRARKEKSLQQPLKICTSKGWFQVYYSLHQDLETAFTQDFQRYLLSLSSTATATATTRIESLLVDASVDPLQVSQINALYVDDSRIPLLYQHELSFMGIHLHSYVESAVAKVKRLLMRHNVLRLTSDQ